MQLSEHTQVVAPKKNLRIVLQPELQEAWKNLCVSRGIKQQVAIDRVLSWFMAQDDLTQAMVLGQISPSADILAIALNRLQGKPWKSSKSDRARIAMGDKVVDPSDPHALKHLTGAASTAADLKRLEDEKRKRKGK